MRGQQNGILIQPTQPAEPSAITSPNQQSQRQITVQRIGRDARPLQASEITRYQHMFAPSQAHQRQEPPPRRSDVTNFVPDRQERPGNSRLRNLAQRIPRLNPIATTSGQNGDFRVIQWSEQRTRGFDNDYVLRLPVLDLSRSSNGPRIMNPAPVHSINTEAVVNNPRPASHVDHADAN